jgi:deoxyinosine 3'endonuclease (endonuclease V)
MIAAFDVYYLADGRASAAAVLFAAYKDSVPAAEYKLLLSDKAADYIPGEFYRRELPGILALMKQIDRQLSEIIVDGHVMLGKRAGLGWHLFDYLNRKIPVIGVAKSKVEDFSGAEVYRGSSTRPLYVTAAGMKLKQAVNNVKMMHGAHRIPTLLRHVDKLAKENARISSGRTVANNDKKFN